MRPAKSNLRTLDRFCRFRSAYKLQHNRTISSSPQIPSNQKLHPQNTFSNSENRILKSLCEEKKFKEAIDVLCQQKRLKEAVQVLNLIERPSAAIYSSLLQLCLQQRALEEGKKVHAHIDSSGFVSGKFISNRLLEMYCKCDSLSDAQKVFDEMLDRDLCSSNIMISGYANVGLLDCAQGLFDKITERDNFSWTAMISGYVRRDRPNEALELYRVMQRDDNFKCNKFTVSSVLAASAAIQSLHLGKEIHGHIVRTGMDSDEVVWSALSDMYGKCGSIYDARHIFDKTLNRDVVSWTAMIGRYFEVGNVKEGFLIFSNMLKSGVRPNDFTFAGVLNACAQSSAENLGKQVHGYMMRIGFNPISFASSALVHMYSKCGNIEIAHTAFKLLPHPDLVSWTSLINGYAQNGQPLEALNLFRNLLESGTRPDHVTFVGVLSACTHAGLVDKGLEYFESIQNKYGLKYSDDHYACVVDLLGKAGRFEDAENIIKKMTRKPDKYLWASLLGGCRIHGNLELAKKAANSLFELEPENAATYVTLANIYATAGKYDEVSKIRKLMDERGVRKKPGLSWTEVKGKVNVFLVGDTSHPRSSEIYEIYADLLKRMKEEGYVPKTDYVLHDVEEEQKEQNLNYHSEKLAVVFGIIATPRNSVIKVYKNLRTCVDCHTAIKFISKIVKRKIIVRDSSRFHCFEDGNCSCKDYW